MVLWDVSKVTLRRSPQGGRLSLKQLEASWADLAREDASRAHQALCVLIESPSQTIALLKGRVRPVPYSDRKTINRLLGELEDRKFTVRARAEKELLSRGEAVLPLLRAVLKGRPSAEARQRMERLMHKLEGPVPSAETLRGLWTVELLEQLGSTEARRLLKILASGDPSAWVTQEAKASLKRSANPKLKKR
jgi:hypothetical protein